jgi:replication-associated recombination protein RarA
LYWGLEGYWSGHPDWMWTRLKVIVSEDIGASGLPADVHALYDWYREDKEKGGDGALHFANATVLAANAPKTRIADWALTAFDSDKSPGKDDIREIPDEALDMHTRRGLSMGRGDQHFWDEAGKLIQPPGAPEVPAEIQRLEEEYRKEAADQSNVNADNDPR